MTDITALEQKLEEAIAAAEQSRHVLRELLTTDIECSVVRPLTRDNVAVRLGDLTRDDLRFILPTTRALVKVQALAGPGLNGPEWLNPAIEHLAKLLPEAEDA